MTLLTITIYGTSQGDYISAMIMERLYEGELERRQTLAEASRTLAAKPFLMTELGSRI